jgi:hypothetical protein
MSRIYDNSGFATRMNISSVVVVLVIIYGLWELWAAFNAGPDAGTSGYLFGFLFVAGGLYGMKQILDDARDMVVRFDADESNGVASVWRPFIARRIEGDLGQFRNWRFHVKIPRANTRTYLLLTDHPANPRSLQIELRRGVAVSEGLRRIAPNAVEEFEEQAGSAGP